LDKPVFDAGKINEAISSVCGLFDEMELSLAERWWVVRHIEAAARKMMGENLEKFLEEHPEL